MSEKIEGSDEKQLESWKEIAAYLKRDVRTVIRWEKSESLPVHRHLHQARSSVYAYPSEINAWSATRQPRREEAARWRRPFPTLAFAAVLMLSLLLVADAPFSAVAAAQQAAGQSGMITRQVWAGPENVDTEGMPTPDGRSFTFIDWSTGDVAVRNVATGEIRRITNKGSWTESPEYGEWPVVSPDGAKVAFGWANRGLYDLRIVPLGEAPQASPRVVYRNEDVPYLQPHAWSPDGTSIATVLWHGDGTFQMALISAADGGVQILKSLEWRVPEKVSSSPDGRYIAYDVRVREDSPDRDIFILATDGRQEVPLVQGPAIRRGVDSGRRANLVRQRSQRDHGRVDDSCCGRQTTGRPGAAEAGHGGGAIHGIFARRVVLLRRADSD